MDEQLAGGSGVAHRLQFQGAVETMPETVSAELVPTLREALANVVRHAKADQVRIQVSVSGRDGVELVVDDDGVGPPDEVVGGRGLVNMRRRAEGLGGGVTIEPRPEGGTRLRWWAPA